MVGMFAFSKSGHDKGKLYAIVKEEGEYVYLSDGAAKPIGKPKKKNKKHIQIIKRNQDEGLREQLLSGAARDENIKRAIKLYESSVK